MIGYDIITVEKTKPNKLHERENTMSDELLGIGAFVVLFVGGLVIYRFVERWRKRKRSQ